MRSITRPADPTKPKDFGDIRRGPLPPQEFKECHLVISFQRFRRPIRRRGIAHFFQGWSKVLLPYFSYPKPLLVRRQIKGPFEGLARFCHDTAPSNVANKS